MATFGLTPVVSAFPTPAAEDFPNYIQFQANGTNLGAADADTVNFVGGRVTRGTGENSGAVTVTMAGMVWRDVTGNTTLVRGDAENGIATTGSTGTQTITVPADTGDAATDLPVGACVVLFQAGAAGLAVQPGAGVTLLYRTAAFTATAAGRYATLTLVKRSANIWLLCGDMGAL